MSDIHEQIERAKDWAMAKAYLQRILCSFYGRDPHFEILDEKFEEFIKWMDEEGPLA